MKIIENKRIAKNIWKLTLKCPPEAYKSFRAGQFAHVKIPESEKMLLRRPFSISGIDEKSGTVSIIFQVVGEGTLKLSQKASGTLDIIMPLGNGFPQGPQYKRILLIGGGMGVAPLRSVIEKDTAEFDAVLGFKTAEYAFYTNFFKIHCKNTMIATENGSAGKKGFVTDLLKLLDFQRYDTAFACGPSPMLKALQQFFKIYRLPVFASLEERMGCGMGGCAVCACKIKAGEDYTYKKVCAEGPVFNLKEVDFE